ncbi:MAG: hypothetical protein Q4C00_01970 [Bacillota bacterium]|nr:hypothetical protein [Bacillota bacterium]
MEFIEALFREMMKQGALIKGDPKQMALQFYAPLFLLLSISDATASKEEKAKISDLFTAHIDCCMEKYAVEKSGENKSI